MLLLVACGGTQPLPDIDATIEARVTEERATEATVEARAQAIAKAMVTEERVPEATVEARTQAIAKAMIEATAVALRATLMPTNTAVPATSATAQKPISGSIKVRDIVSEFTDNAIAATNKYSGQTVTVIGDVKEIDYDSSGDIYIAIGSGWNHVRCIPSDSSEATQLSPGSEVTVTGTFSKWDGDWVFLYPCSVIN
jgi:hypothetical protein